MARGTYFDSIARYRIAAILLFAPVLNYIGVTQTGNPVVRIVYWTGTAVIVFNLVVEGWKIYQGRREVRKMIRAKKETTRK